MATYEYEIGLAVDARDNVEDIVSVPPSPDSQLPQYSLFRTTGVGDETADGYLACTWHFDFLPQADLGTLEAYITGQSSVVHIQTKVRGGTYLCYQAYMHLPKLPSEGARIMGGFRNVVFRFTHLEAEACV